MALDLNRVRDAVRRDSPPPPNPEPPSQNAPAARTFSKPLGVLAALAAIVFLINRWDDSPTTATRQPATEQRTSTALPAPTVALLEQPLPPRPELVAGRWFAPRQSNEDASPYGFMQANTWCLLATPNGLMIVEPATTAATSKPLARVVGQWVLRPVGFAPTSYVNATQSTRATSDSVTFTTARSQVSSSLTVAHRDHALVLEVEVPRPMRWDLTPGCAGDIDSSVIEQAFVWATDLGGDYQAAVAAADLQEDLSPSPPVPIEQPSVDDEAQSAAETVIPQTPSADPAPPPFFSQSPKTIPPSTQGRGARITQPEYPSAARRAGEEGTVTLRLLVLPSGDVDVVEIEQSSGSALLDRAAAQEARKRWRLTPGSVNGVPEAMWHSIRVTFRLSDS